MILYTAAHGGFRESVPLGGGAAICNQLVDEWSRTKPFDFRVITPKVPARDIVNFSEREYAKFSRDFERQATEEILRHDPRETTVLVNDVSEGPDFEAIKNYRIFTIYHVDVVAYVSSIYLRGIRPETTVKWYRHIKWMLPSITQLIWQKQEASINFSTGLIMPSQGMKEVMLRCYPSAEGKIHVLPWGVNDPGEPVDASELRAQFKIPKNARILLTLSRISPEKGQDLLLEKLIEWEKRPDYPSEPLWLFICGEAAFMQGAKFLEKLKRLAGKLEKTQVVFPGYVDGKLKLTYFSMADLYIFPSRHESYGLTLLEALAAGVPAVCLDHSGAREIMKDDFGAVATPDTLISTILELLNDHNLPKMRTNARLFALRNRFSDQAASLARLLS